MADDPITPAVPLAGAAELLNERIEGLCITGEHLRQLLSNARSAKVGMYVDGEPRLAPYFRQWPKSQPGAPLPAPSAVAAPAAVVSTSTQPFAAVDPPGARRDEEGVEIGVVHGARRGVRIVAFVVDHEKALRVVRPAVVAGCVLTRAFEFGASPNHP